MRILILAVLVALFVMSASLALANPFKALFEEATASYHQGDYDKAIALYNKTNDLYSQFAPTYFYLGLVHKDKGSDLEKVKWHFKKAIEIDPNFAEAHVNLGKVYYNEGEFDKAQENCLKALQIRPDLLSAHLSLAWIYLLGKSQPREAIYHFRKITDKQNIPIADFGLGVAYFMDDQRHQVLEMITSLRRSDKEQLAEQLEEMVRSKHYVTPKIAGMSLVSPRKQQDIEVKDFPAEKFLKDQSGGRIQVRLKD